MNILVIASLTPAATANYLIRALRDLGHEVFVCSDIDGPMVNLQVRAAVDISHVCSRNSLSPDIVIFIEGGTMRLFPLGLDRMTCLTAWYGIDTHMDYAKHLRIGRLFDVTFIAQKEYVGRLREDGLRQTFWLPLGFAPELMPSPMPSRTLDIAHVGSTNVNANPPRHALMATLRREFPSHYFGPASPHEMGNTYASTRLVFNRSVNNDVNMRFFEAAGAGAVLVTDPIVDNGVEELFDEGKHFVIYQDEASLLKQVRGLLADPVRCQVMGQAARQRTLERHTYRHRAESLLSQMRCAVKVAKPEPDNYFSAFISLDMLGAALGEAGRSITTTSGGTYRRTVGAAVAVVLQALAGILTMLERVRHH